MPSRSLEAPSPRYGEKLIKAALAACAIISVLTTTGIVVSLLLPTISFFGEVNPADFFLHSDWAPTFSPATFGVLSIVVGTLSTTLWGMLFAVPIGLAIAIYLSEYASPRARKIIKPVIEVLAGIPTVAIGLFAITALKPFLENFIPALESTPFAAGVAGVAIGLMITPIIASISDDAMRSVPGGLREAAYGLGSTRMKVATRVVLPAAISGVVASIVLAGSRAIGETMIVLLAAGSQATDSFAFTSPVQTMTAFIATTATGDIATGTITYDTIFAVGSLLFLMTLVMNVLAIRLVRRFREVYE
ncbi:MAG: phosphate ABC transporter permease subunit PstC [Solirubrobacterales bacterium 67-14]|nr:MAG: phosphate ABC transporter permease subunit PstC [Solirubrobacterales bacterium 67-14]